MTGKHIDSLDLPRALVALDSAVATACETLLPPEGCANPSVAVRLESELQGLRRLASGGSHDWQSRETAVLYSSWYQLGHVNLAYNIARVLVERWADRLPGEKTLHIVDIGAGTSALPIAFELLRSRYTLPGELVLHLVDSSKVMLEHGLKIFDNLRDYLGGIASARSLLVTVPGDVRTVPTGKSAFCLLHAVYPDNEDLKHRLSGFVSRSRPFCGVATCYCKKLDILKDVEAQCLTDGFECTDIPLKAMPYVNRTPLRRTQQYRKRLFQCGREHFRDRAQVERLLTRDVPLWPWEPAIREYVSRA